MKRRTLTETDKKEIGLKCCNCGSTNDLQYHHILSLALGGRDINSNMCCMCYECHYKLHHEGKSSKVNRYGDMIKIGQARARKEGKHIGKTGIKVTITKADGSIITGKCKEIADIFERSTRTIQIWCKEGISDKTKIRLGIKDISCATA